MSVHLPAVAIVLLVAIVLPALIAACIAFGCRGFARRSGWAGLSEVYAAGMMPRGRKVAFQSVGIGKVTYLKCVEIHADREGVFMRLPFGFNLGHRVLLIPWADLRQQRKAGRHHEKIRCEVGFGSPVAVELPREIIEWRARDRTHDDSIATTLRHRTAKVTRLA